MAIPADPDVLLTRKAAALALTEAGFPVSAATLATKAVRGHGPAFRKFGPRPLYRWSDAPCVGPVEARSGSEDDQRT